MKKLLFLFLLCITSITSNATENHITSTGSIKVVSNRTSGVRVNHYAEPIDCPDIIFNLNTNQISIDFGNQPIENYNVTISSPFTDVDYYVTSSYTTIPLVVDGYSDYTIIIETSDGDVFEGTLAASEYASTQMF